MGHGMATYRPTLTWTPTLISSCPVFCSKLGKDALSSPASTQTSAQCKFMRSSKNVMANSPKLCIDSTSLQRSMSVMLVNLENTLFNCGCWITPQYLFFCASLRVRHKQNKYPILFLTQGISEMYPQLMDIRCQTTQIAISFAQSENILVRVVALKSRIVCL